MSCPLNLYNLRQMIYITKKPKRHHTDSYRNCLLYTSIDATNAFLQSKLLFAPAKAAKAGGVATSALEMSQNSARMIWTFDEVDVYKRQIICRTDSHNNGRRSEKLVFAHSGSCLCFF